MRFCLVGRVLNGGLLQLHIGESLVAVRRPSLQRQLDMNQWLVWTWLDGTEYALLRPEPDEVLRIVTGDRIVCSGRILQGLDGLPQALLEGRVTLSKWQVDGQALEWIGGHLCWKTFPRTHTLRQADGIRLAFLRIGRSFSREVYKGVVRHGLPQSLLPIVFAIILTGIQVPHLV
jgi:hypothetical protein